MQALLEDSNDPGMVFRTGAYGANQRFGSRMFCDLQILPYWNLIVFPRDGYPLGQVQIGAVVAPPVHSPPLASQASLSRSVVQEAGV